MKYSLLFFVFFGINHAVNAKSRRKRGSSGQTPPGPLSVWHGETGIASASSKNGIWSDKWKVENMFDENASTGWHSERRFEKVTKTLRVDFNVCMRRIKSHFYDFTFRDRLTLLC